MPYDTINTPGTTIVSPNYPGDYENDLDCRVTIKFSEAQKVSIVFETFDVEGRNGEEICDSDWLEIRDGASASSPELRSNLCESAVPGIIQSKGNLLTLIFHSNEDIVKTGFKIKIGMCSTIMIKALLHV